MGLGEAHDQIVPDSSHRSAPNTRLGVGDARDILQPSAAGVCTVRSDVAGTRILNDEQKFGGSKILGGNTAGFWMRYTIPSVADPSGTTHGRQTHLSICPSMVSLSFSLSLFEFVPVGQMRIEYRATTLHIALLTGAPPQQETSYKISPQGRVNTEHNRHPLPNQTTPTHHECSYRE